MYFPVYYGLDVGGVALLAFAAGFKAQRQGLPMAGAVVLAALAGVCGVLLREVLLSFGTVAPLHDTWYAASACIGGTLGALCALVGLRGGSNPLLPVAFYVDCWGMGLCAAMAASRSLVVGMPPVGCLLLGTLAGLLPGVLRDVCLGDVPQAFAQQFHAVAGVIAAMVALAVGLAGMDGSVQVLAAAFAAVFLRVLGARAEREY